MIFPIEMLTEKYAIITPEKNQFIYILLSRIFLSKTAIFGSLLNEKFGKIRSPKIFYLSSPNFDYLLYKKCGPKWLLFGKEIPAIS